MEKNAIKKFAVWAREELIKRCSTKAEEYGITQDRMVDAGADSINGKLLTDTQIKQRKALIEKIKKDGYEQVIEEVAYTWFNRFAALRFMEVNEVLPSRVRVFTDKDGAFRPQILAEALSMDLRGLDKRKVISLIEDNKTEELYKYLLITQCNDLSYILPGMFQRIDDYTELLFPDNLLRKDSVIDRMVRQGQSDSIPEADWRDQVQIIGWLYQYYNSVPKDIVFANLKNNKKISKEDIPAATQLFTPDWIVRYMVENSLGRSVINNLTYDTWAEEEKVKINRLKSEWRYYLDEAPQDEKVETELRTLEHHKYGSGDTQPFVDSTLIDPCMGSGHILVYAFDVYMQIYRVQGWSDREAVRRIIERNLFGLDIDERAAQLAYFAVMMKACQYDKRFLTRKDEEGNPNLPQPNVYAIPESGYFDKEGRKEAAIDPEALEYFVDGRSEIKANLEKLLEQMFNAKEYGSAIQIEGVDFDVLYARYDETLDESTFYRQTFDTKLLPLLRVAEMLSRQYDFVVTNPPYMGAGNMDATLSDFVKKKFPDEKADLFACFISRGNSFVKQGGFNCMVTMQSWMFLSSFEAMRTKLLASRTITNLMHMENMVLGIAFGTAVTVFENSYIEGYKGTYNHIKLSDIEKGKPKTFPVQGNRFAQISTENFSKIPGAPIAYWAKESIINAFEKEMLIDNISEVKIGMGTGKNEVFVRQWWEVKFPKIDFSLCSISDLDKSVGKWFPYNKGGEYRLWYGNLQEILWFDKQGRAKMNTMSGHRENGGMNYYFRKGITWTFISSSNFGVRHRPFGSLFDVAGSTLFTSDEYYNYILAFLSSNVCNYILKLLNPTLNYQAGNIKSLPIIFGEKEKVENLAKDNVSMSKDDWDSFETSWDFKAHPLVRSGKWQVESEKSNHSPLSTIHSSLSTHYAQWQSECQRRFEQLKKNEEELNRIFIDIYGLQDELTPEVDDKDVTVRKADLQRDIRSFISYAVGCMFGRYSLDEDGLILAGGELSDKWVVISGEYYLREAVERYVSEELSRVDSMAEIYGFSRDGLQSCKISAQNGNLCPVGSASQSGGFDSFQYRRGTVKKLYEGIHELFINSKRVNVGSGNTAYDLCSPEILAAIADRSGAELVSRGYKNAENIDWQAVCKKLTTNHFSLDTDNCIPITDDEYFTDDIVGRFVEFVKVVYGEESLQANLKFIADALGGKGSPKAVIRNYFLNDFYADHLKIYQKRPIYWLFDSGKKNGFKALVYMHRYQPDTIARMRTDYVHEQQARYRTAIEDLERRIAGADTAERVRLSKQLSKLKDQDVELRGYEEKIHHLADQMIRIDLDDGVKNNYEIFKDVLAKIK